ncbi:cytochrome P450-9 [Coleophoma cylindrospora]|uniref:Cytochrome P450-9 n=1 Tax=Coleophoma cylindrospora TaxID=1849047 RepID=A0A3D8S8F7_9HELO|nr:cytochrome P450-9 [Coleophoma cylindrospora]
MSPHLDLWHPAGALMVPALIALAIIIYMKYFYVDFEHIKGLPEVPNGSLVSGHLYKLGNDHASTAQKWAQTHAWPVYQIRLGNRRAIILNSFDAAREFIVSRQTATCDRPRLYTFHGVVSKTSASTIGMNPWDERTKKQRRVVGSYTTAPAVKKLQPMLDKETCHVISGLYEDSKKGNEEIMPHIYLKRLALNIMLMFCYNRRFVNIDDPLLLNILSDANTISSFRSTNSNAQDYIPYLRWFNDGKRTAMATEVRSRRDKWLAQLLETADDSVKDGSGKPCVAQGLLVDSEDEKLTKHDIRTILGGLMSGGFETVFATAIIGTGFLSSPEGQAIQARAYDDLMSNYSSIEEAFSQVVLEEKSSYIVAFVRETLRYYPVHHLLPPRQTYQEFEYNGARIPKGVLVYMNAQSINHDKSKYGPDADEFRPERWLEEKETAVPPPYHFSFGAGARMCTAVNFSNKILYATFSRLILSFKMTASKTMPPSTHYVNYNRDTTAAGAIPRDFKVLFTPREPEVLESCIRKSQ